MQSPAPNSESNPGPNSGAATPPVPPDALKPWYYQSWFLVPTFVWWPCSAILFIRSPWHNGVVSGAVSWAWIIIGGGWIFLRLQDRWRSDADLLDPTMLALAAPGVILTIVTQSLWLLRDRPYIRRLRAAGRFGEFEEPAHGGSGGSASGRQASSSPSSATPSRRRRNGRRRRRR